MWVVSRTNFHPWPGPFGWGVPRCWPITAHLGEQLPQCPRTLLFCSILQFIVPENLLVCENVLRVCFVLLTCLHLKRSTVRLQQAAGEQQNKRSLFSYPFVLFLPTKHPNTNTQIPSHPQEAAHHCTGWPRAVKLVPFHLSASAPLPGNTISRSITVFEPSTLLSYEIEIGQTAQKQGWWGRDWRGDRWQTAQLLQPKLGWLRRGNAFTLSWKILSLLRWNSTLSFTTFKMWLFHLAKAGMTWGITWQNSTWCSAKEWSSSEQGIKMQLEGEQSNGNKTKQNKAKQNVEFAEELRMGDGSMNFKCISGKKWMGNAVSSATPTTPVLSTATKLSLHQRLVPVAYWRASPADPRRDSEILAPHIGTSLLSQCSEHSQLKITTFQLFFWLLSFPASTWAWVTTATWWKCTTH